MNTSSVSELIALRRANRYTAGNTSDGFHLALVIECGGMRAAAAAGIITALENHELNPLFDTIHGASAGA